MLSDNGDAAHSVNVAELAAAHIIVPRVECFEEAYASEPQCYKNTACTACFRPHLAPVAVVERATWEAQFRLAPWNELGRDWRLSNAAKSFKLCGFPSALLAGWVNDIVKKCRKPSLEAWDREYPSAKY
eukprot:jgi/Tetstr1/440005/TSEL_028366.t1